jgi:hypothetical protein
MLMNIRRCLRKIPLKEDPFKDIVLYLFRQILKPHFDLMCP